jgi:hypothetical protein
MIRNLDRYDDLKTKKGTMIIICNLDYLFIIIIISFAPEELSTLELQSRLSYNDLDARRNNLPYAAVIRTVPGIIPDDAANIASSWICNQNITTIMTHQLRRSIIMLDHIIYTVQHLIIDCSLTWCLVTTQAELTLRM